MVRIGLIASAVIVGLMAAISLVGLISLPADALIPVHWNIIGDVDRYGGRAEALLLMPAIALGLTLVLAVVPKIDPRPGNLEKSRPLYLVAWLGVLALLAGFHLFTVGTAITGISAPASLAILGGGGFIAALGLAMHRSRPNFFAGVRTPWTLSSERSWTVTHLWTGRMFMATGIVSVLVGLAGSFVAGVAVLLGGLVASAVAATVISYRVWRDDPDRPRGVK